MYLANVIDKQRSGWAKQKIWILKLTKRTKNGFSPHKLHGIHLNSQFHPFFVHFFLVLTHKYAVFYLNRNITEQNPINECFLPFFFTMLSVLMRHYNSHFFYPTDLFICKKIIYKSKASVFFFFFDSSQWLVMFARSYINQFENKVDEIVNLFLSCSRVN